jgi:hypothetical protein
MSEQPTGETIARRTPQCKALKLAEHQQLDVLLMSPGAAADADTTAGRRGYFYQHYCTNGNNGRSRINSLHCPAAICQYNSLAEDAIATAVERYCHGKGVSLEVLRRCANFEVCAHASRRSATLHCSLANPARVAGPSGLEVSISMQPDRLSILHRMFPKETFDLYMRVDADSPWCGCLIQTGLQWKQAPYRGKEDQVRCHSYAGMISRFRASALMAILDFSLHTRYSACWVEQFVIWVHIQQDSWGRKCFKYQLAAPQYNAVSILYVGGTTFYCATADDIAAAVKAGGVQWLHSGLATPFILLPSQICFTRVLQRSLMHNSRRHARSWRRRRCNNCRARSARAPKCHRIHASGRPRGRATW